MFKKVVVLVIVLSILHQTLADLPVHCVKNQVVGNWEFKTTKVLAKKGEYLKCGHDQPDKPDTSYRAAVDGIGSGQTRKLSIDMSDVVQDLSSTSVNTGTWTMIYDEGFEITIDEYKYFAFSKYIQDENSSYKSICGQTLTGWFENRKTGEKGCLLGSKVDGNTQATDNVKQDKVVQPKQFISEKTTKKQLEKQEEEKQEDDDSDPSHAKHYRYLPGKDGKDFTPKNKKEKEYNFLETDTAFVQIKAKTEIINDDDIIHIHKEFKDHQKIVDRLNKITKSWTAKVPEGYDELSLSQLNVRAGRKKYNGISSALPQQQNIQENKQENTAFKSFLQTKNTNKDNDGNDRYSNYARQDVSDLPKEFTWFDSLNKPVQQRDCGSCYTIATAEMISARLKIKFSENVQISAQHLLDCNYYNQGCDGGYPYLVNKFASEQEMVPENCKPYQAVDGMCSDMCDKSMLQKTYMVKDYKYIGGAYGKSNEREMMLEIQQNGPIVVSFEPGYDFMYYSSGIYHSVDAQDWIKNKDQQPTWEKVDHSVLCYGWGETIDGDKYWLIMNSWGSSWGEEGHFKMRRGTDESHIESMGEAADPIIVTKGNMFVGLTSQESAYSYKNGK